MTRTHTPTAEAAPAATNTVTRRQGAAIVACLLALTSGLGLFALRYEKERRATEADKRVACMVANLERDLEADMRRGC